ncbi:MAG: HEAT repeat domain-containing protein [Deltaproteobacteria bacterium]|jgi:hypothetical protein|nr:HEAT repeat domain-containing protein [Deltaproteobacteria bacterium]MBW2533458.1 HEAT repeat domain-containing protein [Deltaproteobacteria bacterium]
MAKSPIDRIVAMLSSDEPEKRVAAAVVLDELRPKGAQVVRALAQALREGGPVLQRRALDALRNIGAAKAVDDILPLLASRERPVRSAAQDALVSVGPSVVASVEARLPQATPEERRALESVLARVGGKEALSALFAGLETGDAAAAAAAAVAMRERVRGADARQRRSYLSQLERVLAAQDKRKEKSLAVVKAALKMLGYLEDERAVPTLLKYATAKRQPPEVRQEALLALRFSHGSGKPSAKLINALVAAAVDDDRTLAQTALMTLAGINLPARATEQLDQLLGHPDVERVRFVIEMLSHRQTVDAAELLVHVLSSGGPRRSKLAAHALRDRRDAVPKLADAVIRCDDLERAQLCASVLRPMAAELSPSWRKKLLKVALERLAADERGWKAPLDVVRKAKPAEAATGLREVYAKLKRKKSDGATEVLRLLCTSEAATDETRYELAARLLAQSRKDTSPSVRRDDEALELLERLLRNRFDVVSALQKDRSLDLDALYYVGFHFVEQQHPAGADLLRHVADRGGRKKIAKMAKNKLAHAE